MLTLVNPNLKVKAVTIIDTPVDLEI